MKKTYLIDVYDLNKENKYFGTYQCQAVDLNDAIEQAKESAKDIAKMENWINHNFIYAPNKMLTVDEK